jgi:hypothetical protein
MSRNKRVPIPLPIRGLNTMEQFNLSVDSLQARELTNYYFKNSRLQMRPAVVQIAYQAAVPTAIWFDATSLDVGGQFIILSATGAVYRLDTGATIGAGIGGSPSTDNLTICKHGDLEMLIGAREPRITTSPFTAYTNVTGLLPDVANINPINIDSACSHKSRLYYADGTIINYGSVAQMRGYMPIANVFDVQSLLDGQTISRMFSVSGQTGTGNEALFVVFGTGGKVLVYGGDSPGSANWGLVGAYNMTAPAKATAFIETDGDIFVAGSDYCYWFKDLLTSGAQSAYLNSPSKDIQNLWQGLTIGQASHIKELDLIVIDVASNILNAAEFQINNWGDYGESTVPVDTYYGKLVYHKTLRCFSFWQGPPTSSGAREVSIGGAAPRFIMLGQNGSILLADTTKSIDSTTAEGTITIETSWKTPYFAPFEGVGNKVNSVRVWFENTISGYFEKVRAIFDYSDYNSPLGWYTQSMVTQVNPANYGDGQDDGAAQASNQYHPVIGAQGQGGGVSFQFTQKAKSGSSTTQNQSIYAATAYIEEVGELW